MVFLPFFILLLRLNAELLAYCFLILLAIYLPVKTAIFYRASRIREEPFLTYVKGKLNLYKLVGIVVTSAIFAFIPLNTNTTNLVNSSDQLYRVTDIDRSAERQNTVLKGGDGVTVYLSYPVYPEVKLGEVFELDCKLEPVEFTPEPSFSTYLYARGVDYACSFPREFKKVNREESPETFLFDLREVMVDKFQKIYPEPYASIVSGMTIGSAPNLPNFIEEKFNQAGLTHILVVSGSNITLIVALVLSLASRLRLKSKLFLAVAAAFLYVLIVGLDPPALRALFFSVLSITALLVGRGVDFERVLTAFAFLYLVINPLAVYDASFLLSLFATLGLVLFTQIVRLKPNNILVDAFLATLAATVFTSVITYFYFDSLPLFGLFYNVIVLPLVPFITIFGFFTLLISFLWLDLAVMLGFLNYLVLDFIFTVLGIN